MPTRVRWIVAGAFLVIAPRPAICQTSEQAARVGEFYAATDGFSGNVVVFRDGRVISNRSYGLANIELNVPITATTRFAIGSVTKQFTAASILLLQEQGLLQTTDKLSQYYPATPDAWKKATLRQLLQHTSGIPDGFHTWGAEGLEQAQHPPGDVVKSVASLPLVFPSGSRMQYNNMGYLLLGLVVERVSGQSYADFLQKHFFSPLHMVDTGLGSTNAIIPNRAYGYEPAGTGLVTAVPVPFTSAFAAGGLYSTGQDIAKWLIALHGGRVLRPASYQEMTTPGLENFGYGVIVSRQSEQIDFSFAGRVPGFATETEYFPASKTGIVILSNKLSHNVSPGSIALDTDLMHLATEPDPSIRSLRNSHVVAATILSRYTGSYHLSGQKDGPSVLIGIKAGRLTFTPAGKETSTLIPQSDANFYVKEEEEEIAFRRDDHGAWLMDVFQLPNETMTTLQKDPNK